MKTTLNHQTSMRTTNCLLLRTIIGVLCVAHIACALGASDEESQKPPPQQIEGAFGVNLGYVLDTTKVKPSQLWDGELDDNLRVVFAFTPRNPLPPFTHYYVQITPKSHRIYSIFAVVHEHQPKETKEGIDVVVAALSDKYSKKTWDWSINTRYYFELGARTIHLGTRVGKVDEHAGQAVLVLTYKDKDLYNLAKRECAELENEEKATEQRKTEERAKAVDKSGI